MKRGTALMVLVSVLGLLITTGCAWISGKRVNPVAQAGLRDTVEIEVVELNTWDPGDEPYVHRLSITDASVIEGLLNALDTGLRVTLKVQCIPEYELRFHLRDGALETFGYSCSGATFIRGEQDFWGDEDYRPPEEFDALLQEQLAATVPSEVNVAVEAGLSETVRIEVFETVTEAVHAEEAGKPAVVQAQVVHRLTLTDPDSRRGRPGMEEETAVKPTRSLRYLARQMLLIGCALLMAGCAGVEEAPAADLAGTRWALTSLDGDGLIEGTEITLTFEEAFLGGKMTCNGYGGTPDGGKVTVRRDGSFRVELLAVTVQLCSEPEGIMEQEAAYISALHSGTAYRVIDDRLKILDAEGEAILVFDREISARQGNQTPQRAIRKLRLAA